MALPTGVSTCILTAGSITDAAGTAIPLTLTVTPVYGTSPSIVWSTTGVQITNDALTVSGDAGTQVQVTVPHVDQAGFLDQSQSAYTMWAYTCVLKTGRTTLWTKSVQPLVGQSIVDLDTVATGSVTAPVSAPYPTVISVNGQTGIVTIDGGSGGGAVSSVAGRTGDVVLTKSDVALGNVNNTSDANKPVSTAQQAAISLRALDATTVHTVGNETVGGIKTFSASPLGPDPTTAQQLATKQYVDDNAGVVSDADASTKGILRLTGDLGGTATSPTTPTAVHVSGAESISGVKTFASSPIVPLTPTTSTQAASKGYVDANIGTVADASTTVKGIVKLAGDLSGTALLPTVPGLAGKLTTTNNLSEIATAGGAAQLAAGKNLAILDVSGLIFTALIPDFSASKINAGNLAADRVAVDTTLKLRKVAGVWPARPTRSANVCYEWFGPAPMPPIDSTYALTGVDFFLEDAS